MAFRSSKLTQQQDMNMTKIEQKVKKAKSEKKIFMVLGRYEAIRKGLVMRGWLEKVSENQLPYITANSERLVVAFLLKNSSYNFIWQPKHRPFRIDDSRKPFVNSIQRERQFDFTTKDGLKNCIDHFSWNCVQGVTDMNFQPRTHILNDKTTKEEFFEDFRRTAFTSFISYLDSVDDLLELFSRTGTISTECIDFSIGKIELMMKIDEHEDIDMSRLFDVCAKFPKNQKQILVYIQQLINGSKKIQFESNEIIEELKLKIKKCAEKMNYRWPHLKYDGYKNIWIFKPIGYSSGNGIILENNEDKIREIISSIGKTYIAQKYIERPMTIHNRKFDIRVYLLTFVQKQTINIWLYRDCYVKFATKLFNLDDFSRSIHITNYAVQKYFMNPQDAVPNSKDNMWTLKQLIEYFGEIEIPRLWEAKIYPAIKKILLAMIIPSLEYTDIEHKSFELNGADFMITFDHETSLLEINSVPALFFSKTVMEMITTKLLDDVLKVVVDHSKNPEAYTGDFELIYSQEIPRTENSAFIEVIGKKIEHTIKRNSVKNVNIPSVTIHPNTDTIEEFQDLSNSYIYLKQKNKVY